jgi:hypothetical protein
VAQEINAIIFAEAIVCVDIPSIPHLSTLNAFKTITRVSLHGQISLRRDTDDMIGFASIHSPYEYDSNGFPTCKFSITSFELTFPRIKEIFLQIHSYNTWCMSFFAHGILYVIDEAVGGEPKVKFARLHTHGYDGKSTTVTFRKKGRQNERN